MARRGRPPLSRGVYSFEEPQLTLPAEVVLDTSFVVNALLPAEPFHVSCAALLERIADQGTVVYFSRLLQLELLEATYKVALIERYGRGGWKRRRVDGRARRRADRLLRSVLGAWMQLLEALDHGVVEIHEVIDGVPDLMSRYALSSYDAVHAATVLYLGVPNLVALDVGFCALPAEQLILYTNADRVRPCRTFRARQRRS